MFELVANASGNFPLEKHHQIFRHTCSVTCVTKYFHELLDRRFIIVIDLLLNAFKMRSCSSLRFDLKLLSSQLNLFSFDADKLSHRFQTFRCLIFMKMFLIVLDRYFLRQIFDLFRLALFICQLFSNYINICINIYLTFLKPLLLSKTSINKFHWPHTLNAFRASKTFHFSFSSQFKNNPYPNMNP